MTESGYGHLGRIPNYGGGGGRGQPDCRNMAEPPACIQNAMMTKDKKPFTYTPGGLDLSQIRTPSMARRLARQRSQDEQEQHYAGHYAAPNGQQPFQGGAAPPPPAPFQGGPPPPPPPPPLVIHAPTAAAAKPETVIRPIGERPEIVIPENPIGMLRKTNSPYHWEQENAEKERLGTVPKFVEKAPSPLMQQNPPMTFSQQPPATYTPQVPNNVSRPNYPYGGTVNQSPESPLHKPEPQYPAKPSIPSPGTNTQTPTRDLLQRQDSQFNKSPTPFGPHGINSSPNSNGSPISPSPNSPWKQPDRRESPAVSNASPQQRSPFSPTLSNRSPQFTTSNTQPPAYQNENPPPATFHTLPRASPKVQDNYTNNIRQSPPKNIFNNTIYNNVRNDARPESPKIVQSNPAPWRSNTLNRNQRENDSTNYGQPTNNQTITSPPYMRQVEPPPVQPNTIQQNPWKTNEPNIQNQWKPNQQVNDPNQWNQQRGQISPQSTQQAPGETRYQSHISIPVTPRKPQQQSEPECSLPQPHPHKEVVFVTQEPVYYHQPESPKVVPAWVKSPKKKTPPPEWCERPLDGRKSLTRELVSPPREKQVEPEWVQKSQEMRSGPRDLTSPPRSQQNVQPTWSTKPSDNRKSLPRDSQPTFNHGPAQNGQGNRVIPIQMEVSSKDLQDNRRGGNQQPQLRIIIDMQQPQGQSQSSAEPPYSQPTQRIMRVLSPQLVRMDQEQPASQPDLPSLSANQPRTRIIPIQLEGGGNDAPNRRVYYHHFTYEGPPRQSKAFRVLQAITGTTDADEVQSIENEHGYSDL